MSEKDIKGEEGAPRLLDMLNDMLRSEDVKECLLRQSGTTKNKRPFMRVLVFREDVILP